MNRDSLMLSPGNRVISNDPESRRDGGSPRRGGSRLVSGAAETRAAAAGGTHRALVRGLSRGGPGRTRGQSRTWPGARAVPKASSQLAEDRAGSILTLAGRTGKEKAGKWHQPPLSSRLYGLQSQRHVLSMSSSFGISLPHLHLPRQEKPPQGLRAGVLWRGACLFPSPTHPAPTATCRVLCDPRGRGVPAMGSWVPEKWGNVGESEPGAQWWLLRDGLMHLGPRHAAALVGPPMGHPEPPGPPSSNPPCVRG